MSDHDTWRDDATEWDEQYPADTANPAAIQARRVLALLGQLEARNPHATPPTPDALDAIRARAEAATEGPWEARHGGYSWVALYDDEDRFPEGESLPSFEPGGSATPADADFIAHARTDIPLLLEALDEARDEVVRIRDARNRWIGICQQFEARATATESARDAAEGALREVRALADETEAWEWRAPVGPGNASYANGYENGRRSVARDLRDALAPVTTDETEGGGE